MKTKKYTQGEWEVKENNDEIIVTSFKRDIALMIFQSEESKANAKLIAAAPRLLEALNDLLQSYRLKVNITEQHLINNALEAIRQATE